MAYGQQTRSAELGGGRSDKDKPVYKEERWDFQVIATTGDVPFSMGCQPSRPGTVLGMTKVSARLVRP